MEKWRTGIEDRIQFSTFFPLSTVHSNPKFNFEFLNQINSLSFIGARSAPLDLRLHARVTQEEESGPDTKSCSWHPRAFQEFNASYSGDFCKNRHVTFRMWGVGCGCDLSHVRRSIGFVYIQLQVPNNLGKEWEEWELPV